MKKHIVFISLNREHEIGEFSDSPNYNAFVDAVYMAKERLLEASSHDEELHDLISDTSFNQTFSLSHRKYIDIEPNRLAITINYESCVIDIRYTYKDVQLDITNHTIEM